MSNTLKIDFGSGYNPKAGFMSCDITTFPHLDFYFDNNLMRIISKGGIEPLNSVECFHLRNVIHHIENLENIFNMFKKYLISGGILYIEECTSTYFYKNLCLDNLWYRYVIYRKEIWISQTYRDYMKLLSEFGYKKMYSYITNEKEISCWKY